MPADPKLIVGIDLGTTNSLVGWADERGPRLIPGPDGDNDFLLPSVVGFDDHGRLVSIGRTARAYAIERPLTTVYSIKRLMGRSFADTTDESARLPYRVQRQPDPDNRRDIAAVAIGEHSFTPPQISALILAELKRRAEKHLGQSVTRAVITVPAQFDDAQRQATRDAGQIAGLDVVRIVNEPTAAALAYGLDRAESATIAVYDLGGGTFDISILRVEDGVFEVLSTNGDTHLGGDDFDRLLMDVVAREVHDQFGLNIASPAILQQLRTLAEQVKIQLSQRDSAAMEITINANHVYRRTFTRVEFEQMIDPLVERTIDACRRAMTAAGVTREQIAQVVMVGGSTRVPYVRHRVAEVFQRTPYTALNPEHVVALGAAVQASILMGTQRDLLLIDVTPLSLGIETLGGAMGKLIGANVRVPCQATELFTTFQDGQTNVKINVLQGERELAKDCRSLGTFELSGIPPMPAGMPKIEVMFLIDQNGILNVSAKELRSGKSAEVQIVPSHGLTRDEVRHMQQEALAHAREDMKAHHLIDVRMTLSFDLNKAEQMIAKYGQLLNPGESAKLQAELEALRKFAEKSDDPAAINVRREAFNHATIPLAEKAMTAALQMNARQIGVQ